MAPNAPKRRKLPAKKYSPKTRIDIIAPKSAQKYMETVFSCDKVDQTTDSNNQNTPLPTTSVGSNNLSCEVILSDCLSNNDFETHSVSQNRSVILGDGREQSNYSNELLRNHSSSNKNTLRLSSLLDVLLNPFEPRHSLEAIEGVNALLNTVSREVSHQIECKKQLIAFNIPDHIPIAKLFRILHSLTEIHPTHMIRLRKTSAKWQCPILLTFVNDHDAKAFMGQKKI
ncbi:MAG: hypothetical protein ACRDDF_08625 [Aeromonas sp.]